MKDSLDILLVNVSEDVTEYEPEFVAHDSLNILRTDVICHHGILGMKWGIRRYQNKDGSLTAAGKKRYYAYPDSEGDIGNILTEKGKKAFKDKKGNWKTNAAGQAAKSRHEENVAYQKKRNEEYMKRTEAARKKGDQYRKDVNYLTASQAWDEYVKNGKKLTKRLDDAADLGLRALEAKDYPNRLTDKNYLKNLANAPLEKTSIIDGMGYSDDVDNVTAVRSAKKWLTWEDQTIGYSMTADLVNQGYTKDKVKEMRNVLQIVPTGQDDIDDIGFEMQYVDDKFIDACYLIKEAQKNKSK